MSIFLWFSGILTLLVYLIYKFFQRNADFWKKRGFTFLGSEATGSALWNFWNKTLPFYVDLKMYKYAKELRKPIFGFIEFSSPVAFLLDLDLIKNIFIKDFDSFMNRRLITLEKADPLFHKTLLLMEGERWRELRGKMSPTFTTGKIKRMFGVFQSSSTKLVKYLEKQSAESEGLVDFSDGWQRYAMDVIASAAFGLDSRAFVEDDPIFTRMGKKLSIKLTFKLLVTFIVMTVAPRMVSGTTNIIFVIGIHYILHFSTPKLTIY
jgi:cytochrome P450 family 6